MMYFKTIINNFILGVGTTTRATRNEITEEEYNTISAIMREKPIAPDGYDYKLKIDLTWELVEKMIDVETEVFDEDYTEAGKILLGVSE